MPDAAGLALVVFAGLAIWWFGFWWGILVFIAGFTVSVFVQAVNIASTDLEAGVDDRPRRRNPVPAQIHAVASGFLGAFLGFGVASVAGASSADFEGIVAASAALVLVSEAVGRVLDMDWTGALGSWGLLMLASLVVVVPLAAYVAPGYEVHGVAATIVTTVLVLVAESIVGFASPWRTRWNPPDQ